MLVLVFLFGTRNAESLRQCCPTSNHCHFRSHWMTPHELAVSVIVTAGLTLPTTTVPLIAYCLPIVECLSEFMFVGTVDRNVVCIESYLNHMLNDENQQTFKSVTFFTLPISHKITRVVKSCPPSMFDLDQLFVPHYFSISLSFVPGKGEKIVSYI